MATTLRLNEAENQALSRIREKAGCTTDSATLRMLIAEWERMETERNEYRLTSRRLERELQDLKRAIADKFAADAALLSRVSAEMPSFSQSGHAPAAGFCHQYDASPENLAGDFATKMMKDEGDRCPDTLDMFRGTTRKYYDD